MPTRYQQLRQAVAHLAAPAEAQVRRLDKLFRPVTGEERASGYGNDELALELDGIFSAADDMLEHGELTATEKAVVRPLDELLNAFSGSDDASFWQRDALFHDTRWEAVRACAANAMAELPDEERAVGRSANDS